MNKIQHHFDTPIVYQQTDIGYLVTVFGKTIGVACLFRFAESSTTWCFSPLHSKEAYHGLSLNSALLNYFAHQYGGGLCDNC